MVSILTAIQIRNLKADYLPCYEFYYICNETGKRILFQEKWHYISQWKFRFFKTRKICICNYSCVQENIEKFVTNKMLVWYSSVLIAFCCGRWLNVTYDDVKMCDLLICNVPDTVHCYSWVLFCWYRVIIFSNVRFKYWSIT